MTFSIEKERIRAVSEDGILMGYIAFPRVRPGLVNITQVVTLPGYRNQNVDCAMMDALLPHLMRQGMKAALTCPFAQQYAGEHPQWKSVLPREMHFTKH